MPLRVRKGTVTSIIVVVLVLLTSGAAHAALACFTAFNSTVNFALDITNVQLNERVFSPIVGRIFGALAPCGGLTEWPLYGSGVLRADGGLITLAFRVGTNDLPSCGAVDYQVQVSVSTFTGSLALHNTRTGGTNSSPVSFLVCTAQFALTEHAEALGPGETDIHGNAAE